jgi:hypothetical protein
MTKEFMPARNEYAKVAPKSMKQGSAEPICCEFHAIKKTNYIYT